MACTITKEQLDIFQKFLYRIKLYWILNRITLKRMWKKNFIPLFLNKFDEKKSKFCKFCCNFCKNHFFQKTKTSLHRALKNKQKTYDVVRSRINSWGSTIHAIYLCENSMSHFEQSYLRNGSIFIHQINTVIVSNKE